MRINLTLYVPDAARRHIARITPDGKSTVRGALATRQLVVQYLQQRVETLSALTPWWDNEPLRPDELADAADAVFVLRKAGKHDGEIRAWLLLQRARYDLETLKHEQH